MILKNKKGQTSMEFVILTSFMMLVFIIFFVVIQERLSIIYQERNDAAALQLENVIVNEVKLAESVSDNYYREFILPNNLNGINYTVEIIPGVPGSTEVVIKYGEKERVYFLEAYVQGDSKMGIGLNNISKRNGKILFAKKT